LPLLWSVLNNGVFYSIETYVFMEFFQYNDAWVLAEWNFHKSIKSHTFYLKELLFYDRIMVNVKMTSQINYFNKMSC
jgi:hypothetical protein